MNKTSKAAPVTGRTEETPTCKHCGAAIYFQQTDILLGAEWNGVWRHQSNNFRGCLHVVAEPREAASQPPTQPATAYPKPCGICEGVIQSADDLDWHGYGNCRDVPEAVWDKPELPPLATFLTHAHEFTTQEDATKAMQMGKEIADGVANFMKLAAAAPTGQYVREAAKEILHAGPWPDEWGSEDVDEIAAIIEKHLQLN